ncbi:uncharacterized protein cracdla [Lampris incognitus]|uniref:uncharacterized protein cracdla n=1 Tax=Lampris incognitus TaxID=2546036 RepID=UPI0024B4CBC7|nr:uncharacterized protein cracdla [Lampris incognitus]XP_056145986.1 uncharacterized protein cracdla [Lampris incognitus]
MESFTGDTDGSTEDLPGKKKSKLKILRNRLFGRAKRTHGEGSTKFSQSASDITAGKGLGSEEDLVCSQSMLGSRALSHDSIFLVDQVLSDTEPTRVLSQENVHSKIKALQVKLLQQNMHLGPPPLVLPVKHPDDPSSRMEDDGLPHSPPEVSVGNTTNKGAFSKRSFLPRSHSPFSLAGTGCEEEEQVTASPQCGPDMATSQPSSRPLSPIPKPTLSRSTLPTPSLSAPLSVLSSSPPAVVSASSDFSSPAQFTPCLDTSAARHRMSVKPRNQRASTKGKRLCETDSRPHSNNLNNIDHPVSEVVVEERSEEAHLSSHYTQISRTERGGPILPIISQYLPKTYAPIFSHQPSQHDNSFTGRDNSKTSQSVDAKLQIPMDGMTEHQPQWTSIQPESKGRRGGREDLETWAPFHTKRETLIKTGVYDKTASREGDSKDSSAVAFRSSSIQQIQSQVESTGGFQRPASGSFHFSVSTTKTREEERPRSASFLGTVELSERPKTCGVAEVKSSPLNLSQRGRELQTNRLEGDKVPLREGGPLQGRQVCPWDRRDTLKKTETVTPSAKVTMDTGGLTGGEVEEAKEVLEEEEKMAFGVRLRSTSLSLKYRPDAAAALSSSGARWQSEEMQCNTRKTMEELDNTINHQSKKLLTNLPSAPISAMGSLRQADGNPILPGVSTIPVKPNPPPADDPHVTPAPTAEVTSNQQELETVPSAPQQPQTAPQVAPSEMSWMSLAMEKTRSLQQLFTSRLPRDFTSIQTVTRPQAQTQPKNQGQIVTEPKTQKVTRTEIQTETQVEMQAAKQREVSAQMQAEIQQSTETIKPSFLKTASPAQMARPSLMPNPVQQRTSTPSTSYPYSSKAPQMQNTSHILKQANNPLFQPNTTQPLTQSSLYSASHSATETTESPLCLSPQMEAGPKTAQMSVSQPLDQTYLSSGQHTTNQQTPWSNRGLSASTFPKSTTSAQATASSTTPSQTSTLVSASGRGERTAVLQGKGEGPPLSERRAVWAGSTVEKATFIEKQRAWTAPLPEDKVELWKTQTETQAESSSLANITPLNKIPKPEGRLGVRFTESSPIKVPVRLADREDKWLRKNMPSSSSPSSSPTPSSPLHSMSDSGQPSWMELAKRKSMAWSDKNMD